MTDMHIPEGFLRGQTVRDRVTGFTGVLVSFAELANGSVHAQLQPKMKEGEASIPDLVSMDFFTLEVVDNALVGIMPPVEGSFAVNLGDRVRDRVTGLTGVVSERVVQQNGCLFVHVQPSTDHGLNSPRGAWADHKQVTKIGGTNPITTPVTPRTSGCATRTGTRCR